MSMKIKVAKWGDDLADMTLEFWKTLAIEVEMVEISDEIKNQPDLIFKNKIAFDFAFLEPLVGEAVVESAKEVLSEVKDLGWADILLRQQKHLWPKLINRHALRLSVIQAADDLDSHSVGYVTGKGPMARLAAAVLIQLGFERLAIVSDSPELVKQELSFIQRKYFGIQIHFLSESEMTMQPNNGSIIINTISHDKESDILDDLPYLNYIKKQGLVVDLPFATGPNQLIDEAAHVGMRVLSGVTVRGMRDFLLLEQVAEAQAIQCPFELNDYMKQWTAFHDVSLVTKNVTTQKT